VLFHLVGARLCILSSCSVDAATEPPTVNCTLFPYIFDVSQCACVVLSWCWLLLQGSELAAEQHIIDMMGGLYAPFMLGGLKFGSWMKRVLLRQSSISQAVDTLHTIARVGLVWWGILLSLLLSVGSAGVLAGLQQHHLMQDSLLGNGLDTQPANIRLGLGLANMPDWGAWVWCWC